MTTSPNGNRKHQHPRVYEFTTPEAAEAEYHQRMLASAAGLAKICTIKTCRRRKRCFGPFDGDLPCLRRHNGLMGERFHSALHRLGWAHVLEEEDLD